eukprot:gnl/MRDRNA2_/MRDRNA2_77607_c0_seq2.p1 gnl/MRDRNA2_/MRDRNA2_77607_c0~~gnl/MRDRNA2_/MRDRNA2_77607_c0_seq2.p1  ORF type:complete len:428 (+),score=66.41 gnl/MRDRNA2_/MRDRNA2_77607_c0_seq2:1-1284(+)
MSILRILRLQRLVRLVRVIRVFGFFKELAIIAQSFVAGGRTLMWGGVFVGIVVYVFGIFAVESFGRASDCEHGRRLKTKLRDDSSFGEAGGSTGECEDTYDFGSTGDQYSLFGTLDRAMLTLYTCVTDGCGFDVVYKMVYKTPWVICYWYLFVFITSFGLVNVMVGLFCENVFAKAVENEREMAAINSEKRLENLEKLAKVFKEMDQDGSHSITRAEFMNALQHNETVQDCMEQLELDDDVHLFDTLDVDQGGVLTLEEFFKGVRVCMNGNEPCKVKDVVGTALVAQAILKRVDALLALKESQNVAQNASLSASDVQFQEHECNLPHPGVDEPGVPKAGFCEWLQSQFQTLNQKMDSRFETLNEKMDQLNRRMNDMSEKQERLEVNLANLHDKHLNQLDGNRAATSGCQDPLFGSLICKPNDHNTKD